MSGALFLRNRQRVRPVNLRLFRWMIGDLLRGFLCVEDFDIAVHIVNARMMTTLNETHLKHAGSTDVITFDYSDQPDSEMLAGEIYICLDEALIQAARFRTCWQAELVRYVIHGLLHLKGFDDTEPAARRRMKRQENRLLRELDRRFHLRKLASKC